MSTFRQKVQAKTDWGKPDPEEEAPVRRKKAARRAEKNDRAAEKGRKGSKRPAAQSSVTSHRLFPAFGALWFAALFGLGSLAISSAVLGKLVMAMGLPALVPAAAPPLGLTAHLLVALALTVVGAALGLVLGMRLRPKTANAAVDAGPAPFPAPFAAQDDQAGVPKVRARDAHPDAPPRRPLVLTEAFADPVEPFTEDLMVPAVPGGHRSQGLATSGAAEPAPETWLPVYTPGGAGAQEPLDLAALDFAELDADTPHSPADFFAPDTAGVPATGQTMPGVAPFAEPAPFAALDQVEARETAAEAEAGAAQATEAPAEPAPEMPEVNAQAETAVPAYMPRPVLLAATPQLPRGFMLSRPGQLAAGGAWSPVAALPLDSLGLVQLIERLALAIAARQAADGAGPPPATNSAPPETEGTDSENFSGESTESIRLEDPGAAVQTFGSETPEALVEADLKPDAPPAEPLAPFAKPARPTHAAPAPVHAGPALNAGPAPFSRPQQAPASAIPAAPVPASAPLAAAAPNPEAGPETNEALRTALTTLQRMSAQG